MLKIDSVSIRFGDAPEVVSHVSFTLENGDRLAVVGETGSGKSVLLLAVLGLLPSAASVSGSILLDEKDLLRYQEREMNQVRGRRIAYIPQGSGNGLNPLYTIGHQMCEAIRKHQPCSRRQAADRAVWLLESFGLEQAKELCRRYPFQLSGGMRQRVLVAMGIAMGADLVLADEPTKGLDRRRITMVEDAFGRLGDRSLLCVTHDLRFAKAVSSRIMVMYASRQMESGSSADFFTQPLHPYSQAMLAALPENGLHSNLGFAPPREGIAGQRACKFYSRCPQRREQCLEPPPFVEVGERKVRCWNYAH